MTAERCGYCGLYHKTSDCDIKPAAPPEERRRQHRVLAKSGLVLRDWHDVEPWCSQGECNVEEYRAAPPASEPEEIVVWECVGCGRREWYEWGTKGRKHYRFGGLCEGPVLPNIYVRKP